MRGRNRNIFYFILLAGLLAIIWASYKSFNTIAAPTDRTTSELIQAADAHNIKQATIKGNRTEVDSTDNIGNHFKTTVLDTTSMTLDRAAPTCIHTHPAPVSPPPAAPISLTTIT